MKGHMFGVHLNGRSYLIQHMYIRGVFDMYRVLSSRVASFEWKGSGVLLFCDETHITEFFLEDEFDLLLKFVEIFSPGMCGILRLHGVSKGLELSDIFRNCKYGITSLDEIGALRESGYIVEVDMIDNTLDQRLIELVSNPAILMRHGHYAVTDTDGRLYFLKPKRGSIVTLSNFCHTIMPASIEFEGLKCQFVFDSNLYYVAPNCFIEGFEYIDKPVVRCSPGFMYTFDRYDVEVHKLDV